MKHKLTDALLVLAAAGIASLALWALLSARPEDIQETEVEAVEPTPLPCADVVVLAVALEPTAAPEPSSTPEPSPTPEPNILPLRGTASLTGPFES